MAYMNFSAGAAEAAEAIREAISARRTAETSRTELSALEWSVVALAQRDRLSSLTEPSRVAVAMGALFGGRKHSPRLADPRLEALRRVSVLAWHKGYAVPAHEIAAFHEAGFTTDQYETLLASISRGRTALQRRN